MFREMLDQSTAVGNFKLLNMLCEVTNQQPCVTVLHGPRSTGALSSKATRIYRLDKAVRLNTFLSSNNNETHITDTSQLARELVDPRFCRRRRRCSAFREERCDVSHDV